MAIHYDPSSLDSNKTILETLHRIEKYLKINPIYKVYAINRPYVAGEQYNLTDLVAIDSTLAEGDVVFFTNNYYAFVSAVGSEVFSVANASFFKGETGAQGAQGEQGEAGEDGADTLWYKNNILVSTLEQFTALLNEASHNFSTAYFNRTPKVGDNFMTFVYISSARETYWLQYQVSAVSGGSTTAVYQNSFAKLTGARGEKGDTGEMALVYGQVIHRNQTLVENTEIVLTDLNMIVADFNRAPKADDQFVLLYFDTYAQKLYIGYAEVEGINSSTGAVTTVLYRDMHIVTGADGRNGTDGTNGTDGKDALVYGEIFAESYPPVTGDQIEVDISKFNRTPQLNDYFTAVYKSTTNPSVRTFIVVMKYVDATLHLAELMSFAETTGGTITYVHNITVSRGGVYIRFRIINSNSTQLTRSKINTLLSTTDMILGDFSNSMIRRLYKYGNYWSVDELSISEGALIWSNLSDSLGDNYTVTDSVVAL